MLTRKQALQLLAGTWAAAAAHAQEVEVDVVAPKSDIYFDLSVIASFHVRNGDKIVTISADEVWQALTKNIAI